MTSPCLLWRDADDGEVPRAPLKLGAKVSVLGQFELKCVLENQMAPPLDLETFGRYCESEHSEENLIYVLIVRMFLDFEPKREDYLDAVRLISDEYIAEGSTHEVNISGELRKKQLEDVRIVLDQDLNDIVEDYSVFAKSYSEVYSMLRRDTFFRFKRTVALNGRVTAARNAALW
eukprot:CAMPEP_0170176428 /NCGR_PEP_ID=MMETSP0040_2-20121228/9302_1 /TAXON_ID=641309 /ORGANISM="Lotharella oceanica, Strain CCMP622" /LENGTH=174 /DNA_ID=CAMNT_0010418739 /DNA_START=256 /DNA_END=777 /DNA_ORIENTATION=-